MFIAGLYTPFTCYVFPSLNITYGVYPDSCTADEECHCEMEDGWGISLQFLWWGVELAILTGK